MREHLPTCGQCRACYQRWLLLSKLDPERTPAERRIARGLGLERRPLARILPLGATVLAAAAALVLWVHGASSQPEFTARGTLHPAASSQAFVYDVRPGEAPVLAHGSIGPRDELAFAYENVSAKKRLAIFGVDDHGRVYWFYPAWTDDADDPVAVPIETDTRRHELPEAVRQDIRGSRLDVRALFLDEPLTVREVETLVREHPVGPLPIRGAVESPVTLSVSP
jgi:hypothetical protein